MEPQNTRLREEQLSRLVAHNPPCMKYAVSLFLSGLRLQERCALCIAALSPRIPPVRWKASVVIPAPLEFMALGWWEPGGGVEFQNNH